MQDTLAVPETERPTEPAGRWLDASVLLLYLAMAVWVLGPLWAAPGHVRPDANAADPDFFEWMLRHAVRIFTVGEHPFHTPTLNTPLGVNLLANTGLPKVTKLSPTTGSDAGGTRVRLDGTSLTGVRGVQFGSLVGTTLHVVSSTELLVTAPKHAAGPVSVIVRTNHGSSAPVTYRYVTPPPPPPPPPPPQPAAPRAAFVSVIAPEALYRQPFPMP